MNPRSRLPALFLLAPACALALGSGCDPSSPVPSGPNVVIVLIDTLRPDRLASYGCERETAPFLDRIARETMLFESAQSPAPWTAPSLISLMTSVFPDVHGVHGFPVPGRLGESVETLGEILQEHGYDTAAFTEGGYAKGDFGLDRGFDVYPENAGDEVSYTSNLSHPSRLAANVDRTIDWLAQRGERPFFLFFHTYEVHSPPRAPVEDVRAFRPDFDPAREQELTRQAIETWNTRGELSPEGVQAFRRYTYLQGRFMGFEGLPRIENVEGLRKAAADMGRPLGYDAAEPSPEEAAWVRDLYDAEIRFTDRQLARLWGALEEQGLLADTVVVFTSDHGEEIGEHGRVGHGHALHEELLHVLLMLRLPDSEGSAGPTGVSATPRRIATPVRTIDVMPTLLELVGLDPGRHQLQGQSLVPLIRGEPYDQPAFSHATQDGGGLDPRRTVRTATWRLIVDPAKGTSELYDHRVDPGETDDVADRHPDVVAELQALLAEQDRRNQALRSSLGDVGTTPIAPDSDLLEDLRGLGYAGEPTEGEGTKQDR